MMNCPICNGKTERLENQEITVKFKTTNGVKTLLIKGVDSQRCLDCGEEFLTPDDLELETKKIKEALEALRIKKGLLTAVEIKEIRESLGYSQSELERILGLGAKSFARWETYKADQSKSTDMLLRALEKGGRKLLKSIIQGEKHQKIA